jgi:hypothetical protein
MLTRLIDSLAVGVALAPVELARLGRTLANSRPDDARLL